LLSSITSLEAVLLAAFVLMKQNRMGMVADRADVAAKHAASWPRGTEGLQTRRWRKPDSNLYGAFPVK
jgi:hypothetical protein